MSDQQLELLKAIGERRSDERRKQPGASRKFLIRAGILTRKGRLKSAYGGAKKKTA
ncbi:MAG: hypothetical protein QOI38_446 [Sphingomonadales bacterium]|jgi:hypothetical protein|nr:hypothetical protein [Sphingomonadales bacterium]